MYNYKYLDEISQDKKDAVTNVHFFRHNGLYMCHAFGNDGHNLFDFFLTERDEFITKRQAKQKLHELFPKAKVKIFIVRRDQPRDRF